MRIMTKKRLRIFWTKYPHAKNPLSEWYDKTRGGTWSKFADVKTVFGQTDQAVVDSGNRVCVFDIGGNKFRLIAAVHYNTGIVYVLRVLTHREYDDDKWKRDL